MLGTLNLAVYSPLVIREGSNVYDYLFDYVPHEGQIYVIDKEKFLKKLQKENILDAYLSILEESALTQDFSQIKNFLEQHELLNKSFLEGVSAYVIKSELDIESSSLKKIGYLLRDALRRVFIPGSSIKGAMRTAILYYLIKSDPNYKQMVSRILNQAIRLGNKAKQLDDRLVERYMTGQYFRRTRQGRARNIPAPYRDILRGLLISDGTPIGNESISVEKVILFETSGSIRDLTLTEIIKPNTISLHDIKVDEYFVNVVSEIMQMEDKTKALIKLPDVMNNFYLEVLKAEKEYAEQNNLTNLISFYTSLEKQISGNDFLLRIGWGSGWLSTTIGLILTKEIPSLLRQIRRTYRMGIPNMPFPMSRKLTKEFQPFGWVICNIEWKS